MGNKQIEPAVIPPHGNVLFIQYNQDSFKAGQTVTGSVCVRVSKTFKPKSLHIEVKGRESMKLCVKGKEVINKRREILSEKKIIQVFKTYLKPGDYMFPF